MIGKQYLNYFPKEIAQLNSGLTLYQSRFKSANGTNSVIAGPHPEFTNTDRMTYSYDKWYTYVNPSVQKYKEISSSINTSSWEWRVVLYRFVRDLFVETNVGAQGQSLEDRLLINANVYAMKQAQNAWKLLKKLKILGQIFRTGVWNVEIV